MLAVLLFLTMYTIRWTHGRQDASWEAESFLSIFARSHGNCRCIYSLLAGAAAIAAYVTQHHHTQLVSKRVPCGMHEVKWKSLSRVRLCNPMDCSPPGSSVYRILQAKYWSGLPFPAPGDIPNPGIKLGLLPCRRILYSQVKNLPVTCMHGALNDLSCFTVIIYKAWLRAWTWRLG